MNRLLRQFGVTLGLVLGLCSGLFAVEIRAVRISNEGGQQRAFVALTGAAGTSSLEYKLFVLKNPERLVLDVPRARLATGFSTATGEGVVRAIRTGKLGTDGVRIVLDLNAAISPRSFVVPPGKDDAHRLVLDLVTATHLPPVPVRTLQTAMPAAGRLRPVVIALDAGHGGQDPGARGHAGSVEKVITLQVAREFARQINAEPGFRAVMIRDGDQFIPLQDRYRRARKAEADLFVSIHADAFRKSTAAGSSVFVLSQRGVSSQAARWLANQENAADLVGGVSLDDKDNTLAAVLLDLAQSATMQASSSVAAQIFGSLRRLGKTHKAHVEHANFVVLRSPDVPSVLIETAFISNPAEERRLGDPNHRRRLATAMLEGVRDYFHNQPPPGTWLALHATPRSREHVVSRGETLSLIAVRHGISLSTLRSANQLRGDLLRVGDRLRIPVRSG